MKKFLIMMLIVISVLGISSCFAKSMTTSDFESLIKKLGYEDFGNLDDYSSSNNYTLNNIKTMISSDYSKFFVRIFNSDGTLNTNEFYVCMHSNINVKFKFFYNSSKNIYTYDILNHSNNNEFAAFVRFNISDKTFSYTNENYVTNFFMKYENFSDMSLDTFKSEEFQRLMMKTVIVYADGDILSPNNDLLNARLSYAINSALYNDVEYVGSISYDSFSNKFKFVFTSGFDLNQDYGFYIERFEIKDDDTIEAKGINRLNSHNSHSPAEKGFYGFNGQHGTDVFPFNEEFELDLAGVDTSQRYIYRVCIGAISESDGLLSTTPFIASDLLLFNENTLYTYPYFKFDYTYIGITKVAYDPDYTDPTEPDNPDNPDIDKDYTNIIKDVGDKISDKLDETKTGIIGGIIDGIKGLFIPSEDFFESYWEELSTFMKSKLGFLWEVITFIPNLFQNIIDVCQSALEVYIVEIPEISVPLGDEEYVILESFTFDVYEYFNQNDELLNLYTLYLNMMDFLVGCALVSYGLSVIQDMFGIHITQTESKNPIGFNTDE